MGMEESLDHLSRFMTLAPGDIIAIRIKEGSGRIEKDDEIEAGISSIGILRNKVRAPSMTP
jgi:2-keto-4-pentenoate hydratase/2-oxohepta-3-ene-1,7-dioic acid hydratase in catechol pathway